MKGIRKILVASTGSSEVVRTGMQLAAEEKSWLTVLKVLPPYDGDLFLTGIKNIKAVLDDHDELFAKEVKELARKEGTLVKTRCERGELEHKIVEVATEEKADLIIMAARKSSFLERLLGTSLMESVISRAPCPVFVVGG